MGNTETGKRKRVGVEREKGRRKGGEERREMGKGEIRKMGGVQEVRK